MSPELPAEQDPTAEADARRTLARRVGVGMMLLVVIAVGASVVAGVRADGGVATVFEPDLPPVPGLGPAVEDVPDSLPAGPLPPLGQGAEVDLPVYQGRPLLVNFWATWCGPCVEEMPVLRDAHLRLGDQMAFLGINVQDNQDSALDFLAELEVGYDQARDPMAEYFTAAGGFGMPTTLLVDQDGRIAYRHTGAVEAAQLDDLLADHLDVRP